MGRRSRLKPPSGLPGSIWMAGPPLAVYSGTPVEMVGAMAAEMGPEVSVRDAVAVLTGSLTNREVVAVPDVSDETLADGFIRRLLVSGTARPVAEA